MTEKNDPDLPQEGGGLFRNFEPEPPPGAWDAIRTRLDAEPPGVKRRSVFDRQGAWFPPRHRLYPALTVMGAALIVFFVWIGTRPGHRIHGTVLINQEELSRGTAFLFRVHDRLKPFDSVYFYRKMEIDSAGRFDFRNVKPGAYLLRIQVHSDSSSNPVYRHAYYGDQVHWHSSTLIHTGQAENTYVIRIPERTKK